MTVNNDFDIHLIATNFDSFSFNLRWIPIAYYLISSVMI